MALPSVQKLQSLTLHSTLKLIFLELQGTGKCADEPLQLRLDGLWGCFVKQVHIEDLGLHQTALLSISFGELAVEDVGGTAADDGSAWNLSIEKTDYLYAAKANVSAPELKLLKTAQNVLAARSNSHTGSD
jgi:hypothetical protein